MTARDRVWLLLAAAVVAVASGCGGDPTASVTGTVTDLAGRPVVSGFILFTPQDGAKYRDAAESKIVDGRYDLPKVSVGPKFVSVMVTSDRGGSIDVTPAPDSVDLKPGPQVLDFTLPKLKKERPERAMGTETPTVDGR